MSASIETVGESAFPPLSEISQDLRVQWYRSPIAHARLKSLSVRTDKQGWYQAGGHLALFASLCILAVLFWQQALWWAFIVNLWFLGFVATFFKGTSTHELGHGTVFKTKRLNRAFLYLFSLISWWDPFDYSSSHTYHHRYTTHPEADRENLLPVEPSLHPWLLFQLFTLNLLTKPGRNFGKGGFIWNVYLTVRTALGFAQGHLDIPSQEWLKSLHENQPEAFRQSVIWCRILLVFHTGVLLIAMLTGWWFLPLILSMPSFIANFGSYFLGTTQHCGLRNNVADFRKNTRSIKLNPVLAFLYWHMNWHTEHHMYAGVPCYNLKELAQELKNDMPKPHTLYSAWKEMREIWHRQQSEAHYQFDTPVPVPKHVQKNASDTVNDQLATTIGDLAPSGLKGSVGS
jgi:fatty acid desaturase